jgi:nucleotide-binding universal stress UspA family protein
VKPQANNILVPVEIHENVVPVVTWAVLTARALRSRLTLLHVNESLKPFQHRSTIPGGGIPGATITLTACVRHARSPTPACTSSCRCSISTISRRIPRIAVTESQCN